MSSVCPWVHQFAAPSSPKLPITVQYSTVQYSAVHYSGVQYSGMQYSAELFRNIQYEAG